MEGGEKGRDIKTGGRGERGCIITSITGLLFQLRASQVDLAGKNRMVYREYVETRTRALRATTAGISKYFESKPHW
jgi:hypothetical protein